MNTRAILAVAAILMGCAPKMKKAYVNDLNGIEVQKTEPIKAWPDKSDLVAIPFASAIEVDASSEKRFNNYRDPWVKVKYNGATYWASLKEVSSGQLTKFYMIVTKAGLNLRESPNTKAAVLGIIPFEAKGPILERAPEVVEIQERRGFWLKVDHRGKIGWIFSGFVITGNTKDELKLEKTNLKSDPIELKELPAKPDGLSSLLSGRSFSYTIPAPECYISISSKLGHILVVSGEKFLGSEAELEKPVRTQPEITSHLVTSAHFCLCCCGNMSDLIYLNPKGKAPVAYPMHLAKYDAYCSMEGPSPSNEARLSADKTKIYILKKMPICEGTYANEGGPGAGVSTGKVDYNSGVFKIINLTDDSINQIDGLDVPAAYSAEWASAISLKSAE